MEITSWSMGMSLFLSIFIFICHSAQRASSSREHRYRCPIITMRETEVNVSRPRRLTLRHTHQTLRTLPPLPSWVEKPSRELRPSLSSIVEESRFAGLGFPSTEKEEDTQSQAASVTSSATAIRGAPGRTTRSQLHGQVWKEERVSKKKEKGKRRGGDFFKKKQRKGAIMSQQQGQLSLVDAIEVTCTCTSPEGVFHRCRVKSCCPWWKLQVLTLTAHALPPKWAAS